MRRKEWRIHAPIRKDQSIYLPGVMHRSLVRSVSSFLREGDMSPFFVPLRGPITPRERSPMILHDNPPRPPVHVTDRHNGGIRLSACGRDLYLSCAEAEALKLYLARLGDDDS